MYSSHDSERQNQLEEGRRTLRLNKPRQAQTRQGGSGKPAAAPKGHEAYLKALEASGANVKVMLVGGEEIVGVIKHSDNYTISLLESGELSATVIFKHDISRFRMIVVASAPSEVTH